MKMSGTQKWGKSILERRDINSTENVNDDTVNATGIGPGVDVLFVTSDSSDFRHGEMAVTSGTVALVLAETVALEEHPVDTVLGYIGGWLHCSK